MSSSSGDTYLVLLARYSPAFVEQELIPEIERNCEQFGIYYPTAYDVFQKNKFAEDSLYFHHSYAVADIPISQEYEAIAYTRNGKIQADSIQKCPSKVICFFTAFRTQPSDQAMRGHHELSLIRFGKGVPPMINELFEITERKSLAPLKPREIYLGSEIGLTRLVCKENAKMAAAGLLENHGIMYEWDYDALDKEKSSALYEEMKILTVKKYGLEECDVEEILYGGLFELRRRNR